VHILTASTSTNKCIYFDSPCSIWWWVQIRRFSFCCFL